MNEEVIERKNCNRFMKIFEKRKVRKVFQHSLFYYIPGFILSLLLINQKVKKNSDSDIPIYVKVFKKFL